MSNTTFPVSLTVFFEATLPNGEKSRMGFRGEGVMESEAYANACQLVLDYWRNHDVVVDTIDLDAMSKDEANAECLRIAHQMLNEAHATAFTEYEIGTRIVSGTDDGIVIGTVVRHICPDPIITLQTSEGLMKINAQETYTTIHDFETDEDAISWMEFHKNDELEGEIIED